MKAPAWWRRWFGGKPANPTGPASPPPALDFRSMVTEPRYSAHAVHTAHRLIAANPHVGYPGPCPCSDCKAQRGEPWYDPEPRHVAHPALPLIPPRPGTFVEALPGSLPFDMSPYIPTEQLRIVQASTPETEPEMLAGQTLEQARQKRAVRHAHAIRTFNLEFARLVRVEADGNYSRMARQLGVAPSVVGRWASGKLSPSIHNFLKFCVEYEYVLGDFTGTDEFE